MATEAPGSEYPSEPDSIFIGSKDAPVYDIPISVINRPIPSVLDDSKVEDFACKIKASTVRASVCTKCYISITLAKSS